MQTIYYTYDSGNRLFKFTRPDNTIYQRDRNCVTFECAKTDKLGEVTVTVEYAGATVQTITFSDINNWWFRLDLSRVLEIITPTAGEVGYLNFDAQIFYGGTLDYVTVSQDIDVQFTITNGKTISGRLHPCERTVRYYDTMTDIDFFACDYQYGFSDVVSMAVSSLSPDPSGVSWQTEEGGGGDVDQFIRDDAAGYAVKFKLMCEPRRAVWLRYTNTDGCKRYVACKPMAVTDKTSSVQYNEEGIERNRAGRYLTALQRTITLGVTDVEYGEFMTDIRYADDVEYAYSYGGDWQPCALDSFTYTEDGGTHSATVKIIVNI